MLTSSQPLPVHRERAGFSLLEAAMVMLITGVLALAATAAHRTYINYTYVAAAVSVMDQTANDLNEIVEAAGGDGISTEDISTVVETLPEAFAYGSGSELVAAAVNFTVVPACLDPLDPTTPEREDNLREVNPDYFCGFSSAYGEISTSLRVDEVASEVGLAMLAKNGDCIIGVVSLDAPVSVTNAGRIGDCSGDVALLDGGSVRPDGPPAAPNPLTGTAGNESVELFWPRSPESDVVAYWVYRDGSSFAVVPQAATSTISTSVSGLTNGTTYTFTVRAVDSTSQYSPLTNPVSLTPQDPGTGITLAGSPSERAVSLTWTLPSDVPGASNVTEFRLYRDNAPHVVMPAVTRLYSDQGQDDAGADPGNPPGLVPYQNYLYRVVGLNASGSEVVRSNSITIAPMDTTAPPTPELVSVTGGLRKVDVQFRHVVTPYGDLSGYRIYWCLGELVACPSSAFDSADSFVIESSDAAAVAGALRNWSHVEGLLSDTFYTYQVTAFDTFGNESGPSDPLDGRSLPATPGTLDATGAERAVELTWIPPDVFTPQTYDVRRDGVLVATIEGSRDTYQDTGLAPEQLYTYTVVARAVNGDTFTTNEASARPFDRTPPPIPVFTASGGPGNVVIDWDAVEDTFGDLASYEIYWCQGRSFPSAGDPTCTEESFTTERMFVIDAADPTVFTHAGLEATTWYSYRMKSKDIYGNRSAFSSPRDAITEENPPTPPASLVATPGERRVVLSWEYAGDSSRLVSFQIFRDSAPVASVGATTFTYTDEGLVPNRDYVYYVTTVFAGDEVSEPSNLATGRPYDRTPPGVPNISATGGVQLNTVNWGPVTNPFNDLAGYQVFYCLGAAGACPLSEFEGYVTSGQNMVAVVGANKFDHTSLSNGATWTYRVRSYDLYGNYSALSSAASATTLSVPGTPVLGVPISTVSSLTWTWPAVSGATRYESRRDVSQATPDNLGASRTFVLSGLSQGTLYDGSSNPTGGQVRACNAAGCSAWVWAAGTTLPGKPTASASSGLVRRIEVTFNNPPGVETEFSVWRHTSDSFANAVVVGTVSPSGVWSSYTFADTTVLDGATFYYWVQARNVGGYGKESDSVVGSSAPPAPPAPEYASVQDPGRHWNVLAWSPVPGASRYVIESQRYFTGFDVEQEVRTLNSNVSTGNCTVDQCTFTVFNNWANDEYRYTIRAVSASGALGLGRTTAYVSYASDTYSERGVCGYAASNSSGFGPYAVSNNSWRGNALLATDGEQACVFDGTNRVRDHRTTRGIGASERGVNEISAVIRPSAFPAAWWTTFFGLDSYDVANNFFIGVNSNGAALVCGHLYGEVDSNGNRIRPRGSGLRCATTPQSMVVGQTYFVRGYWLPGFGLSVEWTNVNDPSSKSAGSTAAGSSVLWVNDGPHGSGGTSGIWTGSAWSGPGDGFAGTRHFRGEVMDTQWFQF